MERGAFLRDLKAPDLGPRVPMMLTVALDIARAIEFLHSHGIVHGGGTASGFVMITRYWCSIQLSRLQCFHTSQSFPVKGSCTCYA